MELQDRYIRFDWAVKRLLRHKANFGVLEGFLTVLIGDDIHIVEILESEGNQQTEEDKFNRELAAKLDTLKNFKSRSKIPVNCIIWSVSCME